MKCTEFTVLLKFFFEANCFQSIVPWWLLLALLSENTGENAEKERLFYSSAVFPNLKIASLDYSPFIRNFQKKNHLRRKVLNIFPGISYHTEKWANLLSLSECFEARKEVVIHQKQFYYEIWFMLRKINDDVKMCTSAWREHILVNWVIQFYYFKKIHIWLFFLF